MPTEFPFEGLTVYQLAERYYLSVSAFINKHDRLPHYVRNQLGRASLSIVLNIAEGSAKFGRRDRRNFFIIARGSVFECAALLKVLKKEGRIQELEFNNWNEELTSISKMMFAMISKLSS